MSEPPTSQPDIRTGSAVTDVADLGTVLGIWAHPDDETFLSGGLMAMAREAGRRVVCVTATLGERGTSDPRRWPPWRLAPVRAHEIRASLAALGVSEHHLLDIPDGTCAVQPLDPVVRRLVRIIEDVAPDTIVTFGPDGLTGHADHQAVSAWATAARAAAAPQTRLLYATTTEEFVERWEPLRDAFDIFLADGLPLRTPASALAVELRLGPALLDRKIVALRAQASQTSALIAALGEERVRDWWSTETFVCADVVEFRTRTWGTWQVAA
jgi:LmbE family N-acetylglucosaminyl deacetylase